jgi:predicted N-acetyltransferase YhbS
LFIHEVSVYQQGQGLGRVFMDALIALAKAHSFKGVVLVSVLNNEGFYSQKFGFQVVRTLPLYGVEEYVEGAHVPPLPPTPSYFSATKTAHVMALLFHQ